MKIRVYIRNPDALYDAIEESLKDYPEEEREIRMKRIFVAAERWFRNKETVCVEIDLSAGSARILTTNLWS